MSIQESNEIVIDMVLKYLDQLLSGRYSEAIEVETDSELLSAIVERVNQLGANINEMNEFANRLAKGQLNGYTPNRRNYLAAYLKELHSQLSSLTFKAKLLKAGQMVSKLDYTGELYDAFNGLVERVAESSTQAVKEDESGWEWSGSVNSWRYHQILSALNHLHIMVVEVDRNGKVVYANLPAKEKLGSVEYLNPSQVDEQSSALMTNLSINSAQDNDFPIFREVYDSIDGSWYKITSDQVTFPDGQTGYLHVVDDISEWKKHERQLKISATVDPLTGAYNRKAGMQALENLLTHSQSDEGHCAAFIDVDNLKLINDGYGHKEGDYAIVTIAGALLSSVRDSDTVSRYGGDEFLVVFKGCTLDAAERVISRMNAKIEEINQQNPKPYNLSFSHGVISFQPDTSLTPMDLIVQMDEKMYAYKMARKQQAAAAKKA